MTLLDLFHAALAHITTISPWAMLLIKATLLLAIAWPIHFALARANPRWRTLLWRGSAVGLLLLAVWAVGLPGLAIRVAAPEPAMAAPLSPKPMAVESVPIDPSQVAASPNGWHVPERSAGRVIPESHALRPSERATQEPSTSTYATPAVPAAPLPWHAILLSLWASGAALFVAWLAIGYCKVARLLHASSPAPEEIAPKCAALPQR